MVFPITLCKKYDERIDLVLAQTLKEREKESVSEICLETLLFEFIPDYVWEAVAQLTYLKHFGSRDEKSKSRRQGGSKNSSKDDVVVSRKLSHNLVGDIFLLGIGW